MSTGNNWAEQLIHQESYTPRELAKLLDFAEHFITQEVHRGNLRAKMLGDDVIEIPRDAVIEWMNRRERGEDHTGPPVGPRE